MNETCQIYPLPANLTFEYNTDIPNDTPRVLSGKKNIVLGTPTLLSKDTGSKAFVYKIQCSLGKKRFFVVYKVQKIKSKEALDGLKYEKSIYKLMNELVASGVCPFRLRSYDMQEPENVLITESPVKMTELGNFLPVMMEGTNKNHIHDCNNLVTQILYALEVNYRVGIRHNDLHLHNLMVVRCGKSDKGIVYLNRDKDKKITINLKECRFIVKIFDNDRVTKLSSVNLHIPSRLRREINPSPVLKLFPWHEPSVFTEKLDLFKIMQHLRDVSTSSLYMQTLLHVLNISLSPEKKAQISLQHGEKNFMRYHLVTEHSVRREASQLPKWLKLFNTSNDAILEMSTIIKKPLGSPVKSLGSPVKSNPIRSVKIADLSLLYVGKS